MSGILSNDLTIFDRHGLDNDKDIFADFSSENSDPLKLETRSLKILSAAVGGWKISAFSSEITSGNTSPGAESSKWFVSFKQVKSHCYAVGWFRRDLLEKCVSGIQIHTASVLIQ